MAVLNVAGWWWEGVGVWKVPSSGQGGYRTLCLQAHISVSSLLNCIFLILFPADELKEQAFARSAKAWAVLDEAA